MFYGNLLGPTDGISLIYLAPDHAVCSTFSPLAVTTAPTAILITSWCATPPHKETRPSQHKHCTHFWISVSANSSARYRKPSRPPRVKDAISRWDLLREAIHSSAMSALGGMDRPSHSWFNPSLTIMEPLIEVKQQAHLKYRKNTCEKMLTALPAARSLTQSLPDVVPMTIGLNFATKYS